MTVKIEDKDIIKIVISSGPEKPYYISLINQDKYITQVEISEKLNKTIRTIERNMKKLQEENLIFRAGSDTAGYWNIRD